MSHLRFEVHHLGSSPLTDQKPCDLDTVKECLSRLLSKTPQGTNIKKKFSKTTSEKMTLIADTEILKFGKKKGFTARYEELKHFYAFVEHPRLLVLNVNETLLVLEFKSTQEMDRLCNHIEQVKGPSEAVHLSTSNPNLSVQLNGSVAMKDPENVTVMERIRRPITLVAEVDIEPPTETPSQEATNYPVATETMLHELKTRLREGVHSPQYEQPNVVRNIYSPLSPKPFDWAQSRRSGTETDLYGCGQSTSIDCEIVTDRSLAAYQRQWGKLPREDLYGASSSRKPTVQIIRECNHSKTSTSDRVNVARSHSNGETHSSRGTHWEETSKRLTYNAKSRCMEEDPNGEIFWFVAHEIPQPESEDDLTTLASSASFN